MLTVRAVAAGLLVGAVLCFSNTYFGLQTGWVTMGSLQVGTLDCDEVHVVSHHHTYCILSAAEACKHLRRLLLT